jgi:hypothetical protein
MATYSKTILSGSTDGASIAVAATSTPGTTVHTGPTDTAHLHEIWLYATNYENTSSVLTVQWGGTAGKDSITLSVDPNAGLVPIVSGLIIKGNATALVVRAFSTTANTIAISGFVNTIS